MNMGISDTKVEEPVENDEWQDELVADAEVANVGEIVRADLAATKLQFLHISNTSAGLSTTTMDYWGMHSSWLLSWTLQM